jgi:hypothetical protein
MEPPITRMERERATVVAMNASGVTVMAMVAAGINTPPMPKPATNPKAIVFAAVSGLMEASEPAKAALHFLLAYVP